MSRAHDIPRIAMVRRLQEQAARSAARLAAADLQAAEAAKQAADAALAQAEADWRAVALDRSPTPQALIAFGREVVAGAAAAKAADGEAEECASIRRTRAEAWGWAQTRTQTADRLAQAQRRTLDRLREERRLDRIAEAFGLKGDA